MQAKEAVEKFGEKLIGRTIRILPIGDWPGGLSKVTEIYQEQDDCSTVMYVYGLEKQTAGSIFIFGDEEIEIV